MKKTTVTLAVLAVLFAGCGGDTEPADPPTSQDALTTTSDAEPTTQAPPDDVEETSSTPDDVAETTEAGGPPTMPDEAKEDSEAGAEAFALHYIDMINYTSKNPQVGLIEALSSSDCKSCENRAYSVEYSAEHGERMAKDLFEPGDSVALHDPATSTAVVRVEIHQVGQDVRNEAGEIVDSIEDRDATLVFDLVWQDQWSVSEVQVDVSG